MTELLSDAESMIQFLAKAREQRLREPELVARYGSEVLSKHRRRLTPDEVWTLHEQVAVAALDIGNSALALSLVQNVHRAFPEGARASRLTGLYFEAQGTPDKAEALYKKELERDPQNAMILKRMVALKRAAGDLPGAAEALKAYLATSQTDAAGWEELADLYLQAQMYAQAAFCLEELLLQQPANIAHHLLYADTLYTMGGAQNWRTARSYYSGVLEMTNGRELRALYGVCACAAQLGGGGKERGGSGSGRSGGAAAETAEDREAAAELGRLSAEALVQRYALLCPDKLPLVEGMLAAQGLLKRGGA